MTKYIYIFLGIFTVLSLVCLYLICGHSAFYGAFGMQAYLEGPVQGFSLMEMMWWLFLFVPAFAGSGWLLDIAKKTSGLVIYRYRSLKGWWLSRIIMVIGLNLWYFLCMIIIYTFYTSGLPDGELLQRMITVLCHCLAMSAIMVWITVLCGHVTIAFLMLLILECFGKTGIMLGIAPRYLPLVWGMYGYSQWTGGDGGFLLSVAIVVEIVFVVLTLAIPCIFKRLILRSVQI